MRRYIIGALLALSTLCSCVLDYGSSARPEDVNDILYSRVRSYISAVKDQSRFVILTDVLQNGSEAELQFVKSRYFDGYKISVLEDRVILWRDHENSFSRYVVMTDKKPLSEGGEWSVLLENELSKTRRCGGQSDQQGRSQRNDHCHAQHQGIPRRHHHFRRHVQRRCHCSLRQLY